MWVNMLEEPGEYAGRIGFSSKKDWVWGVS